jgi:hypothetical protein
VQVKEEKKKTKKKADPDEDTSASKKKKYLIRTDEDMPEGALEDEKASKKKKSAKGDVDSEDDEMNVDLSSPLRTSRCPSCLRRSFLMCLVAIRCR